MFFMSGNLFAQNSNNNTNNSKHLFHFGLKVAPDIAWFKPSDKSLTNNRAKLGFCYGLITEFGFSKNYAFSTGLEILNTGGKLGFQNPTYYSTQNNDTVLTNRNYKLRYINIPLLLKLKSNQIGALTYFGQFGFDAAFLWKATSDDNITNIINGSATTLSDVDIYKGVDIARLALNVGLGAEYNLAGSTSLVFSVNYNNVFINALRNDSKLGNSLNVKLKQSAVFNYVSLTVGVLF